MPGLGRHGGETQGGKQRGEAERHGADGHLAERAQGARRAVVGEDPQPLAAFPHL